MISEELYNELEAVDPEAQVFVEVNGVVHRVTSFKDDSQGIYLVVDLDQEEREMR